MVMRTPKLCLIAPLLALAACDSGSDGAVSPDAKTETTAPAEAKPTVVAEQSTPSPTATLTEKPAAPLKTLSCGEDIGAAAAARRVAICRNVSPATHPPCNAANSCAMIDDEIARSCALFDGDGAPMAGCGPAPKSMEAAAAVVRRYYEAINARDYATAWMLWGENGRPGQTLASFKAGFAHTRATKVSIGALEPGSGGASSIYQPVPVTIESTLDDGSHQRFRGTYVVRRINDVDGASAAQLRWHLGSASLRAVPAK